MCIYNYNKQLFKNENINQEEYDLLSKIYKSIRNNDNLSALEFTNSLIQIQSSPEKVKILQDAISSLK